MVIPFLAFVSVLLFSSNSFSQTPLVNASQIGNFSKESVGVNLDCVLDNGVWNNSDQNCGHPQGIFLMSTTTTTSSSSTSTIQPLATAEPCIENNQICGVVDETDVNNTSCINKPGDPLANPPVAAISGCCSGQYHFNASGQPAQYGNESATNQFYCGAPNPCIPSGNNCRNPDDGNTCDSRSANSDKLCCSGTDKWVNPIAGGVGYEWKCGTSACLAGGATCKNGVNCSNGTGVFANISSKGGCCSEAGIEDPPSSGTYKCDSGSCLKDGQSCTPGPTGTCQADPLNGGCGSGNYWDTGSGWVCGLPEKADGMSCNPSLGSLSPAPPCWPGNPAGYSAVPPGQCDAAPASGGCAKTTNPRFYDSGGGVYLCGATTTIPTCATKGTLCTSLATCGGSTNPCCAPGSSGSGGSKSCCEESYDEPPGPKSFCGPQTTCTRGPYLAPYSSLPGQTSVNSYIDNVCSSKISNWGWNPQYDPNTNCCTNTYQNVLLSGSTCYDDDSRSGNYWAFNVNRQCTCTNLGSNCSTTDSCCSGLVCESACFVAGTKIVSSSGEIAIERIKVGDSVLSRDENGYLRSSKVYDAFSRMVKGYFQVVLSSGKILRVTEEHPFWDSKSNSWIAIKYFFPGDQVVSVSSNKVESLQGKLLSEMSQKLEIKSMEWVNQPIEVFNFSVDQDQNYFAGGVLVHNKNKTCQDLEGGWSMPDPCTLGKQGAACTYNKDCCSGSCTAGSCVGNAI